MLIDLGCDPEKVYWVFGLKHGSVFAGMAVARWLRA
jgi:hypothetical protein